MYKVTLYMSICVILDLCFTKFKKYIFFKRELLQHIILSTLSLDKSENMLGRTRLCLTCLKTQGQSLTYYLS